MRGAGCATIQPFLWGVKVRPFFSTNIRIGACVCDPIAGVDLVVGTAQHGSDWLRREVRLSLSVVAEEGGRVFVSDDWLERKLGVSLS